MTDTEFFTTPELIQRLQLVEHLLTNTNLVPIMIAEQGGGKTRFLNELASNISSNYVIQANGASFTLPDALISYIANELQMTGGNQNYESVRHRITRLLQQENAPTILIDNAELLPPATLLQVIRLSQMEENQSGASIVLSGTNELKDKLQSIKADVIAGDVFQVMEIPRLSFEQAKKYSISQFSNSEFVEQKKFEDIYAQSGGLPGNLNKAIDLHIELPAEQIIEKKYRLPIAILASVLLMSFGLTLYYQDDINQFLATATPADTPPESGNERAQNTAIITSDPLIKEQDTLPSLVNQEVVTSELIENELSNSNAISLTSDADTQAVLLPVTRTIETPQLEAETETETETIETATNTTTTTIKTETRPIPSQNEKTVPSSDSSPTKVVKAIPVVSKSETPPNQTISIAKKKTDWLANTKDSDWTLQLMGTSTWPNLSKLTRYKNIERNQLHVVKTKRQNKPWYVIVFREFPNREAAISARNKLPKKFQKSWPRSIKSLRDSQ